MPNTDAKSTDDKKRNKREITLTDRPLLTTSGIQAWRNNNGFVCALLHFTADPDGATEDQRREGLDEDRFQQEHGLSFSSWAGKAVYPMFKEKEHIKEDLWFNPDLPLWRSWDFGYHRPAVVYAQVHGGLWVFGEVMGEDMTLDRFIDQVVLPYQDRVFPGHSYFIDTADPAGMQVTDKSDWTSFTLLANRGIFPLAIRSEINAGLTIVRQKMATGAFKIHPRCRLLIEGFQGGYRYDEQKEGKPAPLLPKKDGFYDHLQDALRYLVTNAVSLYEAKPKKKDEPSREEKIYRKHGKGARQLDKDLGDFY